MMRNMFLDIVLGDIGQGCIIATDLALILWVIAGVGFWILVNVFDPMDIRLPEDRLYFFLRILLQPLLFRPDWLACPLQYQSTGVVRSGIPRSRHACLFLHP